ncbi:NAD-dependent epimerase/dehydratase family protein [Akkermansiaceae bacterium]|nr:NAD-dependent epimerase/dehydratase family protein [Akkermansiaceae bacterium]MDA7936079.1 NAD-dependent epimerase/dehydratase family protein [bacterium]MDC1205963.1 NAD-dependent epimerase/dehydratase family protein [Akkermansiaceae bacterium]
MNILITGICGFVGSTLAEALLDHADPGSLQITGIDNFSRNGSWLNRDRLAARGTTILHGDIRAAADLEALGPFDWVIDAAANPSVLAGVDGKSSSRQLVEHNLGGTINLLEACKRWSAGFILLSTSRVYSIPPLAALDVEVHNRAYRPDCSNQEQRTKNNGLPGFSPSGITETFSTAPPVSLYGATKITSELLALEYGLTFDFPVWVNRCGVMAGARQFGKPDQGIFAFWIHSWREGRPLKYIGFDGLGHQVRDCLHPRDLAPLILKQIGSPKQESGNKNQEPRTTTPRVVNLSGGLASAMSLRQLSDWCAERFPSSETASSLPTENSQLKNPTEQRPFDLPWVVLDHRLATETWDWQPQTPIEAILEEIAAFADDHHDWIAASR